MRTIRYLTVTLLLAAVPALAAEPPVESATPAEAASETATKDIVDTAVAAGNFKTLASALGEAGLVDTLKGEGPFTVFAPTDEAFAKLPKKDLDALLANKEKLKKVLLYHVVPGTIAAKDVLALKSGSKVKTAEGKEITIRHKGTEVTIDGVKVSKTDIACSNGVIHAIDKVLLPS